MPTSEMRLLISNMLKHACMHAIMGVRFDKARSKEAAFKGGDDQHKAILNSAMSNCVVQNFRTAACRTGRQRRHFLQQHLPASLPKWRR